MKILSLALILAAGLSFVWLGCSDTPNSVVAPGNQTSVASSLPGTLSKMGEGLHSATGSGHWNLVGVQSRIRCSFSAVQHLDGSSSGNIQNSDEGPVFKFHGTITDLDVEANRAKVCWTMTRGAWTPPGGPDLDVTGMLASMIVVDNGEGQDATENDLVSAIWFDVPGAYYPAISMTIEELNALGIDAYLDAIYTLTGASYDTWVYPAIDKGSVKVR